jgi:2-amino-4-hydroxy-6-hydroxymethyldihydropteridine diphosphokinase
MAGEPEATLVAAAVRLGSLGQLAGRSSLYRTEPVGYAEQPRFVNAVVALETELAPRELLDGLLGIEQEFGRDRSAGIVNGPRTLDLDLLLYGDWKVSDAGLEVPHPRMGERTFVLFPLFEVAQQILDARTTEFVSQLLHSLQPDCKQGVHAGEIISCESWSVGRIGHRDLVCLPDGAGTNDADADLDD